MSDPYPCGPFRVRVLVPAEPAIVRVPVPADPAVIRRVERGDIGPAGRDGKDGGPGATARSHPLTVEADGQTGFALPMPPLSPADVVLFVNGAAYRAPDILLSAVLLTWAGPFALSPDDAVFAAYA